MSDQIIKLGSSATAFLDMLNQFARDVMNETGRSVTGVHVDEIIGFGLGILPGGVGIANVSTGAIRIYSEKKL